MTFDWTEYLYVAQQLAGLASPEPSREARYRSAISRAYYAAHNKAREKLEQLGAPAISMGSNVHQQVIALYENGGSRPEKIIGDNLQQLRTWRNKADYNAETRNWDKQFNAQLKRADQTLKNLQSLSKESS